MKDRLAQFWDDYRNDVLFATFAALLAFGAFGLGRATAPMPTRAPLTVEPLPIAAQLSDGGQPAAAKTSGAFVASKNGTKYYLPICSGANRIKEANKIWFSTVQEAEENGYEPAKNCPGL